MDAMQICWVLWIVFFVVWVIWGFKTKATQTHESVSSRLSYTILTVAAFYLMFGGDVPRQYLRARLFQPTLWTDSLGIAVTVAGIAFAVWARVFLG